MPPGDRPELVAEVAPEVARAAEPDLLADDGDEDAVCVTVSVGKRAPESVEVMRTVVGPFVALPPLLPEAVFVAIEVTTATVGDWVVWTVV